jgi:hypothetical protein
MTPAGQRETVPLTPAQRARLLIGCLPLLFWGGAFVAIQTMLGDFLGERLFVVQSLMAIFVLVFAFQAVNRLRDLFAGKAVVRDDLIERTFSSGSGRYYATFEELGTLQLMRQTYVQGTRGHRYRVYYSPASKLVWKLEALKD